MQSKFKSILPLLFLPIAIIAVYRSLLVTFFQQDEWLAFGNLIYSQKIGGVAKILADSFLTNASVHLVPLTQLSLFLQFRLFNLNFVPYAIISIIAQNLAAWGFYYLAILLTRNKIIAFLSALFFVLSSVSSQSVTWIAASIPTQPAGLFFILSLILFFHYLYSEKRRFLFLACVLVLVGLFFKESIFFLFFLIPLIALSYKKLGKVFKETTAYVFSTFILYSAIRVIPIVYLFSHPSSATIFSSSTVHWYSYVYKIILLPFRVISQSIVPTSILLNISRTVTKVFGMNEVKAEGIGLDILCCIISLGMFFVFWKGHQYLIRQEKNQLARSLIFAMMLMILSAIPFILIPGQAGLASIIEPRDLYISSMGAALFVAITLCVYAEKWFKKEKERLVFVSIITFAILGVHYLFIRSSLVTLCQDSQVRKYILGTILQKYPNISNQTIFYFQSDKSYYGLAPSDTIIPFQSGPGETLLVEYEEAGQNLPTCFFEDQRFYDLTYQGYKECGGRGFGYFRSPSALLKSYRKYHFSLSGLVAFHFDSSTNSLTDISKEVVQKLQQNKL